MALFKRDYNKPGPGVPKNAPKKKGLSRFIEILARDFSSLVKVNVLYQLCVLPAQAMLLLALVSLILGYGIMFFVFAILAIVFSFPVGAAVTAMNLVVSKMLRDEPGFVWHDFKKAFKENFKSSLVPGIIYSIIVGAQIFAYIYYMSISSDWGGFVLAIVYFFSVIVFALAAPYFFLQAAYLDLKMTGIARNSLALAMAFLPRSFVGALLGTGLVIGQFLLFPYLLIVTFIIGYSLPLLLNLMWIWPQVDKTFNIDETLKKRQADTTSAKMVETGAEAVVFEKAPPVLPPKESEKKTEKAEETPEIEMQTE